MGYLLLLLSNLLCGVYAREKLPTYEKLWQDFQDETRLNSVARLEEEDKNLALISKIKRGSNKGGPGKDQYFHLDKPAIAHQLNQPSHYF
jgi:hypothetical protein